MIGTMHVMRPRDAPEHKIGAVIRRFTRHCVGDEGGDACGRVAARISVRWLPRRCWKSEWRGQGDADRHREDTCRFFPQAGS